MASKTVLRPRSFHVPNPMSILQTWHQTPRLVYSNSERHFLIGFQTLKILLFYKILFSSCYKLKSTPGFAPFTWLGLTLSGLKYLYHPSACGNCFTPFGFSVNKVSVRFNRSSDTILTDIDIFFYVHLVIFPPLGEGIEVGQTLLVDAHIRERVRFLVHPVQGNKIYISTALNRLHQQVDAVLHVDVVYGFGVMCLRKLHSRIGIMIWVYEST